MIVCAVRKSELETMQDEGNIPQNSLEKCSYRFLQQTAKAMGLPSNVKKIYLIQLINAKKYSSDKAVELLVKQVRQQREQCSMLRKKTAKNRQKKYEQQSPEISSTSKPQSPPITRTPKRVSHILIRYSPEVHSPNKYPRTIQKSISITSSDRVLRSFNRVKKPSYLLNENLMSMLNSPEERTERVNDTNKVEKCRIVKRVYAKKIFDGRHCYNGGELVPAQRDAATSPPPSRRQRKLSGVYPLQPEDIKLPTVTVRRADGSISKLKAIIQKPLQQITDTLSNHRREPLEITERPHTEPNLLAIPQNLNYRPSNVDTSTPKNNNQLSNWFSLGYRTSLASEIPHNSSYMTQNMAVTTFNYNYQAPSNALANVPQNYVRYSNSSEDTVSIGYRENQSDEYGVYYHKKIRAEQVRSLRSREMARSAEVECQLPRINEVFSKFNSVYCRDVTQPLYVQVENEPEIAPPVQSYIPDPRVQYQVNTPNLEKFYNFKTTNQTLLQTTSNNNTRTVYCTPVISTAKAQPSSAASHALYNIASPPRDNQGQYNQGLYVNHEEMPRVHDFFRSFHCEDDAVHDSQNLVHTADYHRSTSASSIATLTSQEQDQTANITIPEMVEDAFEIISQDGDYMERMGMDIRMQCILCNWAGPKIILEYHIRKEHAEHIVECVGSECVARYSLGVLAARRRCLTHVLQIKGDLYLLSAQYRDPDDFIASLSTLSFEPDAPKTGSMTIYNKVTGEPLTWQGEITDLPLCMPYENSPNCFRLSLSRMDLLPNSANLKLLNRELVVQSPTKVVVGQPELDNIHINMIVKIFD